MAECRIELHAAEPCALSVSVVAGMPWTSPTMTRADESPWPSGLRLVFAGGMEWPASIDGSVATISATAEQVGQIAPGSQVSLRDDETLYASGRVRVRRVPL